MYVYVCMNGVLVSEVFIVKLFELPIAKVIQF